MSTLTFDPTDMSDAFTVSYLPLCSVDGGGFEEEGLV